MPLPVRLFRDHHRCDPAFARRFPLREIVLPLHRGNAALGIKGVGQSRAVSKRFLLHTARPKVGVIANRTFGGVHSGIILGQNNAWYRLNHQFLFRIEEIVSKSASFSRFNKYVLRKGLVYTTLLPYR